MNKFNKFYHSFLWYTPILPLISCLIFLIFYDFQPRPAITQTDIQNIHDTSTVISTGTCNILSITGTATCLISYDPDGTVHFWFTNGHVDLNHKDGTWSTAYYGDVNQNDYNRMYYDGVAQELAKIIK